jgi:hypothetical protein
MVMRYHWGLAIGHIYSHGQAATIADTSTQDLHPTTTLEEETDQVPALVDHMNEPDAEDAEFSLESLEDDLGEADAESEEEHEGDSDDDEQLAIWHDMYGPSDFDGE